MFVTKLDMTGFKSFAGRTQMEFRPGVMAVVGPNGCGKTNIVDALRWVLGEQRTSTLRAERMESVIFNGTSRRRPLGMAEVTLTIENDKGRLPSPYTEIALTRRLFRSGESEYLINRAPCRLKDIQDLFSDTGFGHTGYSIMELAMVERIITGPSEARRALIDEAAGVAKFKARKAAAERRLTSTRESLARLEDIYYEVEKSYRSLKRQATRARRHRDLSHAIELRQLSELAVEWFSLNERIEPQESKLKEIEERIQTSEERISKLSAEILSLEGRELHLTDKANRSQDAIKRAERRDAEMQQELALARQRVTFLQDEQNKADQRRDELIATIEQTKKRKEDAGKACQALEKRIKQIERDYEEREKQFGSIKDRFQSAQENLSNTRETEETAQHRLSINIEETQRYRREAERWKERASSIRANLEELRRRKKEAGTRLKALRRETVNLSEKLDMLKIELEDSSKALDQAESESADVHGAYAGLLATVEAHKAALQAHQAMVGSTDNMPDNLKSMLGGNGGVSLSNRIECDPICHAAIAAALLPILNAIDCSTMEHSLAVSEKLSEAERLILRIPVKTETPAGRPDLPANARTCKWADRSINNKGEFGEFLRNRLRCVLIVPERRAFTELRDWAVKNYVTMVTPEGELYEPDGIYRAGRLDPKAMQMAWQQRSIELQQRMQESERKLTLVKKSVHSTREALSKATDRVAAVKVQLNNTEARIDSKQRQISDLTTDISRCERRIADNEEELKQSPMSDDSSIHKDAPENEAGLKQALKKAKAARLLAEREFQSIEQERLQAGETRATAMADKARMSERLSSLQSGFKRAVNEVDQATHDLATLDAKLAQGRSESERIKTAAVNMESQSRLFKKELDDLMSAFEKMNEERIALSRQREQCRRDLEAIQQTQKNALKDRNAFEIDLIGLRGRLKEVDRKLTEDLDVSPLSLNKDTANIALADLKEMNMADLSLEKMRLRLSSLGPVNMLAVEELKETEERYRFMTDQKKDLEEGIEVLEETIDRINIEARRRYRDTFERINRNFQDLFRKLFDGGEARLGLEGDTDPLEADVRIWATPSGKKLQALSMLSGGEKALTAIALLFAIYQERPSPFCILDEVDAPLDDINVMRFNRIINRFSKETQFLVVTHNKRTMQASDSLFGVTLTDDGTSQLVSVKMELGDDSLNAGDEDHSKAAASN